MKIKVSYFQKGVLPQLQPEKGKVREDRINNKEKPNNWVPYNRLPDNRIPDNRILNNRIPDKRILDNRINVNRVPDKRYIKLPDMSGGERSELSRQITRNSQGKLRSEYQRIPVSYEKNINSQTKP